jgi:hypothetical protein
MDNYLGIILIIIVLLANFNGYSIKTALKENGFEVKNFSGHFRDSRNIFKLAKNTADRKDRTKYYRLGFFDILFGITFLVIAFLYFSSLIFNNDGKHSVSNEFRRLELKGILTDKYLDEKQHLCPTLIIRDKDGNKIVNQNLVHDRSLLSLVFHKIKINNAIRSLRLRIPIKITGSSKLKHLKSLYIFTVKSVQVPEESGQEVLAEYL